MQYWNLDPQPANAEGGAPVPRRAQPLILVADDNESSARAFAEFLRTRNYDVILAHDGLEACEKTAQAKPDVILMDVEMPRLDGLEATRRIRAHPDPAVTTTPIIALTGFATPEEADLCFEAGATCFLGKPVGLVKLIQTVESALHLPSH